MHEAMFIESLDSCTCVMPLLRKAFMPLAETMSLHLVKVCALLLYYLGLS